MGVWALGCGAREKGRRSGGGPCHWIFVTLVGAGKASAPLSSLMYQEARAFRKKYQDNENE